jgi:hypothetical protein
MYGISIYWDGRIWSFVVSPIMRSFPIRKDTATKRHSSRTCPSPTHKFTEPLGVGPLGILPPSTAIVLTASKLRNQGEAPPTSTLPYKSRAATETSSSCSTAASAHIGPRLCLHLLFFFFLVTDRRDAMASPFTPYTYIQCPCSDSASLPSAAAHEASSRPSSSDRKAGGASGGGGAGEQDGEANEDDHTFDPRSPRANYSLYPLEYLLYCEDCHQIRCPRCVAEEIVTYYCPNCLFEVPTSNLKSEGNRYVHSLLAIRICDSCRMQGALFVRLCMYVYACACLSTRNVFTLVVSFRACISFCFGVAHGICLGVFASLALLSCSSC